MNRAAETLSGDRSEYGDDYVSLRWRRHHRLLVMLALIAAVSILGLGDQGIVSYSVQDGDHARTVTDLLDIISRRDTVSDGSMASSEATGVSR